MTITLYHMDPLSNGLKCLLALKEKRLDFTSVYIDLLKFEQHQPEFLAVNPDGEIPVLVHDGFKLSQSTVILEYLEDAFPETPHLRPNSPQDAARMRKWNKFIDEHVWSYVSLHGFHRGIGPMLRAQFDEVGMENLLSRIPLEEKRIKWRGAWKGFSTAELDNAARKVGIAVDQANAQLAHSPWLIGDEFSMADINLFADLGLALDSLFPEIGTACRAPHLLDWVARMHERTSVQATLAMSRPQPAAS